MAALLRKKSDANQISPSASPLPEGSAVDVQLSLIAQQLNEMRSELRSETKAREETLGILLRKVEGLERGARGSKKGIRQHSGDAPSPSSQRSMRDREDSGVGLASSEESTEEQAGHDGIDGLGDARSLLMEDAEVRSLLEQDKAFERILGRLQHQTQTRARNLAAIPDMIHGFDLIIHPESRARARWNLCMIVMLCITCFLVPLSFSHPSLFDDKAGWDSLNVVIDVFFIVDVFVNFNTGFYHDSQVVMQYWPIAMHYLRTWAAIDIVSSVPFDSIFLIAGTDDHQILKMNKVLRVPRLIKTLRAIRTSKAANQLLQRLSVPNGFARLMELVLVLLLGWHYIGCFWWYIGKSNREPWDALLLVDASVTEQNYTPSVRKEYWASFYWAVMMTTGGPITIPPGGDTGQIIYECFVCFIGICLQAYMLGVAASEISQLDAGSAYARQQVDMFKAHLRSLRAPLFLRNSITEYYETLYTKMETVDDKRIFRDLPPTLKVQLAVVLHEDFLKRVAFFKGIEGRIIATLVLCLRSRIYLPYEIVIHQVVACNGV